MIQKSIDLVIKSLICLLYFFSNSRIFTTTTIIKMLVGKHSAADVADFTLNRVNNQRRLVVNPSLRCSGGRIFQVFVSCFCLKRT